MLSACSKPNESNTAASEQNGSTALRIGSDLTYPPFAYYTNNKPSGFDVELVQLLANSSKQTPEFVDTRFANLIPGLNSKKFEVIASALYITPERHKQVNFIPYAQVGGSLITRNNENFSPQQPQDLCGKTVASIKGALWTPKLDEVSKTYCLSNKKPAIMVREFETSPEALQSLLAKSSDVQFEDAAVAKSLVDKVKNKVSITSKEILYPETIGLAIRKDDQKTYDTLNKALQDIKAKGEYQKLLDKFGLKEPSAS